MEIVKKLVGAGSETSPAGTKGAPDDPAEGSKLEKEIEEGKTNAMDVEKNEPSAPTNEEPVASNGGEAPAEVAAQVADSAKTLDGTPAGGTPMHS